MNGNTTAGYAPVNGTELYYEELGTGPALVLLHAGQVDRRMWDDQFDSFAQYCRVVRYDLRDHGLSNAKCPTDPYSDHEDLSGLLDYLQIDQAVLMGVSLGGLVAIDFTLTYPDRVRALLPVGSGLSGYHAPSKQVLENQEKMIKAWQAGDMESVIEFFQHSWTDGPYRRPEQVDAGVRQRVRDMALERVKEGPSKGEKQPLSPPAVNRLSEIRVPTLTIVGTLDMPDMLAISEVLVNGIVGAERVMLKDVAHMVNMEKVTEFNQIVLDFLVRKGIVASSR